MKTFLPALLGGLLFSNLLYEREPGLNLFLLALYTLAILWANRKPHPLPWPFVATYGYTALWCLLQPSPLVVPMHLLSFILLSGALAAPRAPVFLKGFVGATNLMLGMLVRYTQGTLENGKDTAGGSRLFAIAGGVGLSLLLLWIFGSLYAASNPLFEGLLDRFNLSFLSPGWIVTTLIGFLLYRNLLAPYDPSLLERFEAGLPGTLPIPERPFSEPTQGRLAVENLWGLMALGSLNAMLFVYVILDWVYLAGEGPATAASHSQAVHQGVYALLVSVLLAMGLLLVFFRGHLNFYAKNNWLKRMAYLWMALNALLLCHAAFKNTLYVAHSGLTGKRLGVYLFLLLVGFGLATVLIKIRRLKSLMYLLRVNSAALYAVLIFALTLPWGNWITAYNLRYIADPDLEYLMELSSWNAHQLHAYAREQGQSLEPDQSREIEERYRKARERIAARNWREWTLITQQIADSPL